MHALPSPAVHCTPFSLSARTPAAATSSIPASSLHPSSSHLLLWMRESLGFARVVSAVDLVA